MRLLEKIKNLFTDEEEVEIIEEVEELSPKKERKLSLPTFMREKIEKEEIEDNDNEITRQTIHEINGVEKEVKDDSPQFKFPFVFDETDFVEPVVKREEPREFKENIKSNNNLYNATKKEKEKETKKFRPTPIISPVYGVLDKNYRKDEVKSKPEHSKKLTRSSGKKTDFETVRMKAYGSLSDEIKENLINEDKVEVIDSNNLLYEITNDNETTIGDAEENYYDFGVSYEMPKPKIEKEEVEVKIVNHNDEAEEVKADKIELRENKKSKKEKSTVVEDADEPSELELTDDLFSLIDSMYDERNDE